MSVDPPETSKALKARLDSDFTFLCDTDLKLLDALNIRHSDPASGREIAFPTAILVDSKGLVRWTYETETYRKRARPEDIFEAIEQLS